MKSKLNVNCSPILKIDNYLPDGNQLFIKAEYLQAAGSAKARCVKSMLEAYLATNGALEGRTIIESSSGNTGLALVYYGAEYGYKTILVLDEECPPHKMSKLMNTDAKILIPECPAGEDPRSFRINYVRELAVREGYIWLNQYDNAAAPMGHISCAEEIAREFSDSIKAPADYCFVATGTGATLRGVMDGMRIYSPETECIGVEPVGSHALGLSTEDIHFVNFGPGFHAIAPYLNGTEMPRGMQIADEDTLAETRHMYYDYKLECGPSAGMCVRAVRRFIAENGVSNKNFVVIAADGIAPYLDLI